MPGEIVELILRNLDAVSLSTLSATSKRFRVLDKDVKLRLTDKVAKDMLEMRCGKTLAGRWR